MAANARSEGPEPRFPWKYYAARLSDALELMRDDAKGLSDKAGAAYVDKMVDQSLRILKDIEVKEQTTGGGDLKLWLGTNPAPHADALQGRGRLDRPPAGKGRCPGEAGEAGKEEKKPGDKKPGEKKPAKP